jgi:hypothetical protein
LTKALMNARWDKVLRRNRKAVREITRKLLSNEKRRAGWDDLLKKQGVAVEDYASDAVLTPEAEALRTLLTDHGSETYKALVRGAKIGPLFRDEK